MRRFLVAVLIGVGAGYLLMRLSNRRLLSEQLSDEDDIDDTVRSATAP
ncbi:MAG TPA: hypothetical protein VFO59_02525 [Dehalococcoidia bacterium]|nr:hypothetical protein [Dehalococcoidia bacterium]